MPPVLQGIIRVQHVKVINYIENQARNYNENDFIMHFRLSREIAYTLINRFERSPIYTSLRGIYYYIITIYKTQILFVKYFC